MSNSALIPILIGNFSRGENITILDLGCGKGSFVNELLEKNYNAYGCDFIEEFTDTDIKNVHHLRRETLRTIKTDPYQLPFNDNEFDLIVSMEVFEHVMDYETTLKEIHRILKPNGISLNTFPGKYKFIEPHVLVPLASIIKNKWWLLLWAYAGIRNQFQKGKSAQEVAALNYHYLRTQTNYLTQSEICQYAHCFSDVKFIEGVSTLAYGNALKSKIVSLLAPAILQIISKLYSDFRMRVLYLKK